MKINIEVRHYAPTTGNFKTPDKSKIWVNLQDPLDDDSWSIGGGYITNIFPAGQFDAEDGTFKAQTVTGVSTRTVVMEHSNGNRINTKEYSSVQEYLADPIVKAACREHITGGLIARITRGGGEPDRVDFIRTFKIDGYDSEFTVTHSCYDSIIPQGWINEFNSGVITNLAKCKVWDTAEQALQNSESTDDLFGERYFPVLKAPVALTARMESICDGFKGYSTPLTDSEFVYIGIRSKSNEIDNIKEIYDAGGWILCDQEWDW